MTKKKWSMQKGVEGAPGILVLGSKPEKLPEHAYISLTRGEGLTFIQLLFNQLLNLTVMNQMRKTPGLIYAELAGELKQGRGSGQTMTVWEGKTMTNLRNHGSHAWAMKFFTWVIHRKNTRNYYLTYRSQAIPTSQDAARIVKEYGKFYDKGALVRKANPPKPEHPLS
jgi:hypothetical protein